MNNNWNTTVKELITIFRGAVIAVIPWLDKAKIKWKDGESYDDWDKITSSLYENIVCTSLYSEVAENYPIAKYLYGYGDYSFMDYIEIKSKDMHETKFAFVSFQSSSFPLDSVKTAELDKANKLVKYTNLRFDNLEFFFVKNSEGEKEIIDKIEVML